MNHLPSVVGGGTVHWDAKVPRFWDIDFQKRSLLGPVAGADITDWPFTYEELAPFYEEVERLIGVAGDTDGHERRARRPARARSAARTRCRRARRSTARSATPTRPPRSGWHPYPEPMAINSEPYDGRPACVNCGFCSGHGCPIHARVGGLAPLRRALLHGPGRDPARHVRAKVDLDGDRATGVTDDRSRRRRRPRSRPTSWCVAGSAIETEPAGPAVAASPTRTDLIGRGLMFHWFTNGFGFFLTERMHGHRGRSTSHGLEDFADPDFPGARAFAAVNGLPVPPGRDPRDGRLAAADRGGAALPVVPARAAPERPFGAAFKQLMRASLFRDRLAGIQMIGEDLPQRTNTVDLDPEGARRAGRAGRPHHLHARTSTRWWPSSSTSRSSRC